LDLQVRGAQSKPDELSLQILFASIAAALERHNVPATISEYQRRQAKATKPLFTAGGGRREHRGAAPAEDVKGLALRAKRKHIKFEGGEIDRSREAMYLKRTNTAKTG
jgi:hypothetical protein